MKNIIISLVGLSLIFFTSLSIAAIREEPSLYELLQSVLRHERMDGDSYLKILSDMKRAPWLPTISIGYDRTLRATGGLSVTDNISVSSSGIVVGPSDNNYDQDVYHSDAIKVRAVWSLSELVFPSQRLQLEKLKLETSRGRMDLTEYVSKIFLERAKFMGEYLYKHNFKEGEKGGVAHKIDALTQKLDALTHEEFRGRWIILSGGKR